MHRPSICLASALLAGCVTTPMEMRASPGQHEKFQVALPFATVRSNVVAQAVKCYSGGTVAAHFSTEVTDKTPGELTTVDIVQGGAFNKAALSIDIISRRTAGTEVEYFVASAFGLFTKFRPLIEEWATGKPSRCGRVGP